MHKFKSSGGCLSAPQGMLSPGDAYREEHMAHEYNLRTVYTPMRAADCCTVPAAPSLSRACKRHVEMLETAKLYGIQQRFRTAAMQHRVLLNASTVHNEYRWAGRTFWGIAEVGVLSIRGCLCTPGTLQATFMDTFLINSACGSKYS